MSWGVFLILAIVILSILILVHEFGHFIAAKKSGIWVEEFGIGLPPRVFGKKIGETIYSVNLLPIGGFVRLHGESEEGVKYKKKAFFLKPKKIRILVALSGIIMNYFFAVGCFSVVYFIYSFKGIPEETGEVRIVSVEKDSPAEKNGLKVGDIIRSVDGEKVKLSSEFRALMEEKKGKEIELSIERLTNGKIETLPIKVTTRENPEEGQGFLGVEVTSVRLLIPPNWQKPFVALYYGFRETVVISKMVVIGLISVFVDLTEGQVPQGVVGPLGITALLAYAVQYGLVPVLNLAGLISLNLALLNLVPFPPLDGARFVFITAEAIFGRKVLPKVESAVNTIGIALLLLLLLALTSKEVPKLIKSGSISTFVENMIPESP